MEQHTRHNNNPKLEALAGVMYDTYSDSVGGKAWNGDLLPKWAEFRADPLKTLQSDAWVDAAVEAAKHVIRNFKRTDVMFLGETDFVDPLLLPDGVAVVHQGREVEPHHNKDIRS